jgi:hypothetical protein
MNSAQSRQIVDDYRCERAAQMPVFLRSMIRPELISPVIAWLVSSLSLLFPTTTIAQPAGQRCEGGYCYEMRCEPGRRRTAGSCRNSNAVR